MENLPQNAYESGSEDDDDDESESDDADEQEVEVKEPKPKRPSLFEDFNEDDERENEPRIFKKAELAESAPVDELDDEEKIVAANEYVQARNTELGDELGQVQADTLAEAQALANAALLESLDLKLAKGEHLDESGLDNALVETVKDLGMEGLDDEIASADSGEAGQELLAGNTEFDSDNPEDDDVTAFTPAIPTPTPTPASLPPTPPPTPRPRPGSPPPPPIPPVPGGPSVPPIVPPHVRRRPGMPPIVPPPSPPGPSFNVLPASPAINPNIAPVVIERHSAALPWLVVGYLIGRRRGRIKTEEKLIPVQKKLEKEVTDLHASIARREEKIREIVREKAAKEPETVVRIVERITERKTDGMLSADEANKETKTESPAIAVEAVPPVFKKPEKLGKFAVEREKPAPEVLPKTHDELDEIIAARKVPEVLKTPNGPKAVEVMTLEELLRFAEKVTIEQSNLKKMFEKHRLNEKGLRRVLRAYLRGEHYVRTLRENLLSPDKNFELDPGSRPQPGNSNGIQGAMPTGTPAPSKTMPTTPLTSGSVPLQTDARPAPESQPSAKPAQSATALAAIVIVAILVLAWLLLR